MRAPGLDDDSHGMRVCTTPNLRLIVPRAIEAQVEGIPRSKNLWRMEAVPEGSLLTLVWDQVGSSLTLHNEGTDEVIHISEATQER